MNRTIIRSTTTTTNTTNTTTMNWQDEIIEILYSAIGGIRYGIKIRLPHATVMTLLFRSDLLTLHDKIQFILRLTREHSINLMKFATIYKTILLLLKYYYIKRRIIQQQSSSGRRIQQQQQQSLSSDVAFTLSSSQQQIQIQNNIHNPIEQHWIVPPGHAATPFHALIAGTIGGYYIWGNYSSINYQIVLYLTSRVMVALYTKYSTIIREWYNNKKQPSYHLLLLHKLINTIILPSSSSNNNNNSTTSVSSSSGSSSTVLYSLGAATIWGIVMMLFEDTPDILHPSLKSSMDEIYRYQLLLLFRRHPVNKNNNNNNR